MCCPIFLLERQENGLLNYCNNIFSTGDLIKNTKHLSNMIKTSKDFFFCESQTETRRYLAIWDLFCNERLLLVSRTFQQCKKHSWRAAQEGAILHNAGRNSLRRYVKIKTLYCTVFLNKQNNLITQTKSEKRKPDN